MGNANGCGIHCLDRIYHVLFQFGIVVIISRQCIKGLMTFQFMKGRQLNDIILDSFSLNIYQNIIGVVCLQLPVK